MNDLEPEGATLEQKSRIANNWFGEENLDHHKTVALRIARMNHDRFSSKLNNFLQCNTYFFLPTNLIP